jgi:hypothetical protein
VFAPPVTFPCKALRPIATPPAVVAYCAALLPIAVKPFPVVNEVPADDPRATFDIPVVFAASAK